MVFFWRYQLNFRYIKVRHFIYIIRVRCAFGNWVDDDGDDDDGNDDGCANIVFAQAFDCNILSQ